MDLASLHYFHETSSSLLEFEDDETTAQLKFNASGLVIEMITADKKSAITAPYAGMAAVAFGYDEEQRTLDSAAATSVTILVVGRKTSTFSFTLYSKPSIRIAAIATRTPMRDALLATSSQGVASS